MTRREFVEGAAVFAALIWFDIGFTPTKEQSNSLYDMVRALQPGCGKTVKRGIIKKEASGYECF